MMNQRLKELRLKENLTQKDLARKLNISQQAVAKWESGVATPDYDVLNKLAAIYDVTTDYLLGRTDDPAPPGKSAKAGDVEIDSLEFALYGEVHDLDDEEKEALIDIAKRFKKLKADRDQGKSEK